MVSRVQVQSLSLMTVCQPCRW